MSRDLYHTGLIEEKLHVVNTNLAIMVRAGIEENVDSAIEYAQRHNILERVGLVNTDSLYRRMKNELPFYVTKTKAQ